MARIPSQNSFLRRPAATTGAGLAGGVIVAGAATALAKYVLETAEKTRNQTDLNFQITSGNLHFPSDLGSPQGVPYFISFGFQQYQRRSIFDQAFFRDTGVIRLPLPNTLVDVQEVKYDQTESGLIVGAFMEQFVKSGNEQKSIADRATQAFKDSAAAGIVGQGTRNTVNAAGYLAGGTGLADQLLQGSGMAINPFLTVLFKSPTFKRHVFEWVLAPTSKQESDNLFSIGEKFRYHMLPAHSEALAGTLLTYPDRCIVNLSHPKYLYKFKPCVIESMAIDYTSSGQPAMFGGTDAPMEVRLRLNLLEIEYWLKRDVTNPTFV